VVLAVLLAPMVMAQAPIKHVILLSIDGFHAKDFNFLLTAHPKSNISIWAQGAVKFTNAHGPKPSDSFPGILALTAGLLGFRLYCNIS
jgi:predicted AlkP superfamily pyrophosphatase or phosphodiesterase